jgi:hypothetical protein
MKNFAVVAFIFLSAFGGSCAEYLGLDEGPLDAGPYCDMIDDSLVFGIVEIGQAETLSFETARAEVSKAWDNNTGASASFRLELLGTGPHCDEFTLPEVEEYEVVDGKHHYRTSHSSTSEHLTVQFQPQEAGERTCRFEAEMWVETGTRYYSYDPCGAIDLLGEGYDPAKPAASWYDCTATSFPAGTDFRGVWAASEIDVYVVGGGDQGVAYRYDGGCQWRALGHGVVDDLDLSDVWGSSSDDIWVVGNQLDVGHILRFGDDEVWTTLDNDGRFTYDAVWGSGACDVYFGGLGISTDFPNAKHYDCAEFQSVVVDMGWDPITGIWGTASDDVWMVMQQPTYSVWHGDMGGWTNQTPSFADQSLHDVWVTSKAEVFAVGESGTIYHYDGGSWLDQTIPDLAEHFYGVWGTSASNVMAVGSGGIIYHYDGEVWMPMDVPTTVTADLRGIYGLSELVAFAVGDDGTILFYGDEGQQP